MLPTCHDSAHSVPRWLVFAVMLCVSTALYADTTWVAGEVWGTWTRDGNPYLVTDTLIVPLDSTLNIQPGVVVNFLNQGSLSIPFYVYGDLLALGTAGDSIYFLSQDGPFGGIWNRATPNTLIRMEYCVADSINSPVQSGRAVLILKNCRLRTVAAPPNPVVIGWQNIDTVQYCDLGGRYADFSQGGPSVFQKNQNGGVYGWMNIMAPIFGNKDVEVGVLGGICPEVYDNQLTGFGLEGLNCDVYDNQINGGVYILSSMITFHHNYVEGTSLYTMDLSYSWVELMENEIYDERIHADHCELAIQKNVLVSTLLESIWVNSGTTTSIIGNTIVFGTAGIQVLDMGPSSEIFDNIFWGDGENCTGVYSFNQSDCLIRYNDFYNVTAPTYQCELDTGNVFLDPCFRGGYPFDYGLQANSPCIDTGDPLSPLDPDSTRADMGAFYYDQLIDQPPALISPAIANVQLGQSMHYVATATDDNGPLEFGFWDLPSWLHVESDLGLDWVADTAAVSGTVPLDQEDFSFGVWVEDGLAQRDSQIVSVLVSQYTILAGEVTGVLTAEQSPYLVVDEVVIPEGDSLRIEPGVEVRFQWNGIPDFRHRIRVRGTLSALGTPQDTIRFIPDSIASANPSWLGILCTGVTSDTSNLSYVYLLNARDGVQADSGAGVSVQHSVIEDALYGIDVSSGAFAAVDSCHFYMHDPTWNCFIKADAASVSIDGCYFEIEETLTHDGAHIYLNNAQPSTVKNCQFSGGRNLQIDFSSHVDFIGNLVTNTLEGLGYGNGASGIVANNIITQGQGLFIYGGDSILVSNNLFYRTQVGIDITSLPEEVEVENCIFTQNNTGVQLRYGSELFSAIYFCDFFGNDTDLVNCTTNVTNIATDPTFQDTIDFHLSLSSPCIDAGDPDPFFNDVDSTRNDIGCWGGPWGESYPYSPVLSHQPKPIPTEFALLPPYPNPFNSVLVISFNLPVEKEVKIDIYNILGQRVQGFTFPPLSPGMHRVMWNSGSCASGIYIVRLMAEGKEFNRKVVLLK